MKNARPVQKTVTVYVQPCSGPECSEELDQGDVKEGTSWISLTWNPHSGGIGGSELFCCWNCVVTWSRTTPDPQTGLPSFVLPPSLPRGGKP